MIYPFLCAILPALDPALPPAITVAEFDAMVREELPQKLCKRMLEWDRPEIVPALPVYNEMRRFQQYLNYRIALLRAEKLQVNPAFEEPPEFYGEIDYALNIAVSASPVEREKLVDAACWRKLDDLEVGHDMDFEFLCIYRIRLSLLQKYSDRDRENGRENFEAALEKLAATFNEP